MATDIIHVCDSCKKEERITRNEAVIPAYGVDAPVGWARIDLRATTPHEDKTRGLVEAAQKMMKEQGTATKASKSYLTALGETIGGFAPTFDLRHDAFDLCAECAPKLLAFLATMQLTMRPAPAVPSLLALNTPDEAPE